MITIDNVTYDVGITKITRKASFKKTSLGTTLDLTKHYDVEGTYYDYEITYNVRNMNLEDYNNLYEKITEPVEYHIVTLPYGNETITFKAHLTASSDNIIFDYKSARKWGGLKVNIESLEPQKVADI